MIYLIYKPLKLALLFLVLVVGTIQATAQDSYLLSQQWQSRLNRNPAAAGVNGNPFDLAMFYRNQWSGLDNALNTAVINAEGYIPSLKSNMGITFSYDKPGTAKQDINALASYAFRFDVSSEYKLSFGLAAGIMSKKYDPNKLILENDMDPGMDYDQSNSLKADFSLGAELTSDKLTIGLGIVHLGNKKAGIMGDAYNPQQIYTYARYYIPATNKLDIAPSISWLHYDNSLFEFGVSGLYEKKYWAGVAWRPNSAMVFSAGLQIDIFRLGYAYDVGVGDSRAINGGVHEIMLQILLGKKESSKKSGEEK